MTDDDLPMRPRPDPWWFLVAVLSTLAVLLVVLTLARRQGTDPSPVSRRSQEVAHPEMFVALPGLAPPVRLVSATWGPAPGPAWAN